MKTEEDEAFEELAKKQGDWGMQGSRKHQILRYVENVEIKGTSVTDIDLIKQALEYLEDNQHHIADHERHTYVMMYNDCITALKARLAQPEQEPVCPDCKAEVLYECVACSSNNYPPPQRTEPLIGCVNHDCAKCKENT